jgi:hypothetical protein
MNFQIMQHMGGRKFVPLINDVTNKPFIYDNAKKAAEIAAELSAKIGGKFQPRPVADVIDWRAREKNRFVTKEYKPVVWVTEAWWKEIPDHFAHVGVKDKTRIAFTPDAEKGQADRQTAMLPGKYLAQFFGDVLTAGEIRDYAMQHNEQFEQNELKFAKTVEEIERVYREGPSSSCFAGTTKGNLYASGDFAVAYIEDTTGKITARTLCVPERKIYVYLYGDTSRLGTAMKKAGYKYKSDLDSYAGLRLLKEWMWKGFYADWYPRYDYHVDPKDDTFLIVGNE